MAAYREGMKEIADKATWEAFREACKIPSARGLGVDVALLLFIEAMREKLDSIQPY